MPARRAMGILESGGFEAFLVGGCVRDALLGRSMHDSDIATNATPDEMTPLFEQAGVRVFPTGIEHGTITAVIGGEPLEITTYRVDGSYSDSRHPSSVTFSRSIEDDLARRDFTINAMAYNEQRGLIDPFGGQGDLAAGRIACVGDPSARLGEDALRIMRAIRFSSQLGFSIDDATEAALFENAPLLANISVERVAAELVLLLCGQDVKRVLLDYVDILGVVVPELLPMKGFDQHNPYHCYDVLEHTAVACELIPPTPVLRMTALLHDTGKPETFILDDETGHGHCYHHPHASERIAHEVMERMHFSNEFSRRVTTLVAWHDAPLDATSTAVRHWLNRLGPDMLRDLLHMKRADVGALAPAAHEWLPLFDEIEAIEDKLLAEHACYSLADLAVNGGDMLKIGIPRGPQVGEMLDDLLEHVLDEDLPNDHAQLLAYAEAHMHDGEAEEELEK